jgi:hypothetical protein
VGRDQVKMPRFPDEAEALELQVRVVERSLLTYEPGSPPNRDAASALLTKIRFLDRCVTFYCTSVAMCLPLEKTNTSRRYRRDGLAKRMTTRRAPFLISNEEAKL